MEESLRVLQGASYEAHHDEQERLAQAMTRVLRFLHQRSQQAAETPSQLIQEEEDKTLTVLTHVFLLWHKQQTQKPLSWRLWMLWAELGCALDVLRGCGEVDKEEESFALLVRGSQPSESFPTSLTHCDKEKQGAFCIELWDAVVGRPMNGAPSGELGPVALRLVEVFVHWMTAAMRGYDVVFMANVAAQLREHLAASSNGVLLTDVWIKFATLKMGVESITKSAASVAVTVMVLSAAHRAPEVARYLEMMSSATVDELSCALFPQPHSSVAIVAMALGLAVLNDASSPNGQLQSGNASLLSQFALLRIVCLPLLSSRSKPFDDATISSYQAEVQRRLQMLVAEPSNAVLHEYTLRMTEACIEEMIGFFQTSPAAHLALLSAMQSVLLSELFRPKMLNQLASTASNSPDEDSMLVLPPAIVAFLKQFYTTVAPTLNIVSPGHLVRAFLALSRMEFAREVCASPATNLSMQSVTQQLEQELEQTASPPGTIFAPVLRSLAMHSMAANIEIPPELNIIAGCQSLAVGLVMQRNLRILLFQCADLIDDALAVVFSGLYNVFEPADAFAHRFLGVCLTHLAQFTPLFTVFPHYLQVTLAAYPANASRQALTKTCGSIFGSLFYSEALAVPTANDHEIVETAQRMVLWAIRKCCDRTSELLADEDKIASEVVSTELTTSEAPEKPDAKDGAVAGETDGLYLADLVFELMKMAPMDILEASAMETERLLVRWKDNPRVLRELKSALFARISQNCEAEKRAWLAAWYIEVDNKYPVERASETKAPSSRL